MTRFFFAFILCIWLAGGTCAAQDIRANKDSLDTSILIKPNDLLHVITDWDIATTDGFTYRVNSGLYGFYGPQPSVYLDGMPVDFSFFKWQNLNMLPEVMQNAGSISYSSNTRIYRLNIAPAGFMNLQTEKPDSGFSAAGSFTLGNQIEDPGPASYDSSRVTPNIDRRGPHYYGGLSYLESSWYAKARLSLRQHQPTNLNNHHRIGSYSYVDGKWYAVKNTITNGLAEAGYSSQKWQSRVRMLFSDNEEYLFFQPFGREIPANTGYRQLTVQGSRKAGPWTFNGRYSANLKDIKYRINNKGYDFDWRQLTHRLALSAAFQKRDLQLTAGGLLERTHTEGLQLDNEQALATLYGKGTFQPAPGQTFHGNVSADFAAGETALSLSAGSQNRLTGYWQLSPDLGYDELLYYRQQSSTYWVKRGYNLFGQLGIDRQGRFSSEKNRLAYFKLNNRIAIGPSIGLEFGGRVTRHFALNIPWQRVSFGTTQNQNQGIYTNPGEFYFTSEKGSRYKLSLGLTQHITPVFSHSLDLTAKHTLTGSRRYHSYWRQVPQERLDYRVKYLPFPDLSLSLSAAYRSSARWQEYQSIEGERYRSLQPQYPFQYGTFHTRTPSFFNVGVTAKKWFWDRRLTTTFSVRNLLNTEVRYHTLGLDKALQFVIKASLQL